MKRWIFGGLIAVAAFLASFYTTAYFYGYFDTWADKKDALKQELLSEMGAVPPQIKDAFAECLTQTAIDMAQAMECPLESGMPLKNQVGQCILMNGAGPLLQFSTQLCLMSAQMEAEHE